MMSDEIISGADRAIPLYDNVIVGAGISGLMAADDLKDLNILLLEKEDRAGGRILTRRKFGIPYDLGAIFACNRELLPFEMEEIELIPETGSIGIFRNDRIYFGRMVMECLRGLDLTAGDREIIKKFRADPNRDAGSLPEDIYKILQAFFQVIQPGKMKDYLPLRQADAFASFDISHYLRGNEEVIECFKARLGRRLMVSGEVDSVVEMEDRVQVTFLQQGRKEVISSKTVILTPPAPVVLGLLESMSDISRSFLGSLRYEEGTVVVLCLKGVECTEFSYIVTPDLPTSTIIKQHTGKSDVQILFVYYAGEKSEKLQGKAEAQIILETLASIRLPGIGTIPDNAVLFSDIYHWPMVGPIISEESYAGWNPAAARPSERVFLAGEYVHVTPHELLPYGLVPALLAGKKAAREVRRFLEDH